jgi:hypothetical protein
VTDRAQRTRKTPKKVALYRVCQVALLDQGAEKIGQTVLVSEPDGQIQWPSDKGLVGKSQCSGPVALLLHGSGDLKSLKTRRGKCVNALRLGRSADDMHE